MTMLIKDLLQKSVITIMLFIVWPNAYAMLSLSADGSQRIQEGLKNHFSDPLSLHEFNDDATARPYSSFSFTFDHQTSVKTVLVERKLPVSIRQEGKPLDINFYQATVNDAIPAVLTTGNTLSLNYKDVIVGNATPSSTLITFQGTHAQSLTLRDEHLASTSLESIDQQVTTPIEYLPTIQELNNTAGSATSPLTIYVFRHNDLDEGQNYLLQTHFSFWIEHMESINQAQINAGKKALFSEIIIDFRNDPVIQNFAYTGSPIDKLKELAKEFIRYKNAQALLGHWRHTKYLLLTEHMMDWSTLGIAYLGGQFGMASDNFNQTVAHEIGHMLDGRHEKSSVWYKKAWWCETIMYPFHDIFHYYCKQYTDENKQHIIRHLSK